MIEMSAFKTLQDVSNNFETELRQASGGLHSAIIKGSFEDCISERLSQLSLFSAKLTLLRAKSLALTSQITENDNDKDTVTQYTEEAAIKIVEKLAVKSITQSEAVKALITANNKTLDPEQIEKKNQIIAALFKYREQEMQLRQLETNTREKMSEYSPVREEWDRELRELRAMRHENHSEMEMDVDNPVYLRLSKVVDKLELMRWLLGKLVCSRGHRDWLSVPQQVCELLRLARTPNTVAMFSDIQE